MDSGVLAFWVGYVVGAVIGLIILWWVIRGAILSALAADRQRVASDATTWRPGPSTVGGVHWLEQPQDRPTQATARDTTPTVDHWLLGPSVVPSGSTARPEKPMSQAEQISAQAEEIARLRSALRQAKLGQYTRAEDYPNVYRRGDQDT